MRIANPEEQFELSKTKVTTDNGDIISRIAPRVNESESIAFDDWMDSFGDKSTIKLFFPKKTQTKPKSVQKSKLNPDNMKILIKRCIENNSKSKLKPTELNIKFKDKMSFYRLLLIQFACDPRHDYVISERLNTQKTQIRQAKKFFGLLLFGLVDKFNKIDEGERNTLRAFVTNLLGINSLSEYAKIEKRKDIGILENLNTSNGNLEDL